MQLDLKKAPVLVATTVALLTILAWFGVRWQWPGERMDRHERSSRAVHDTLAQDVKSAHSEDTEMKVLLEGMIRGECLENPRADLARQGLLPTCRRLGIEPTP